MKKKETISKNPFMFFGLLPLPTILFPVLLLLIFISYSSAQIKWTCATQSAQWKIRSSHESIAFNNKLWLLNGYVENSEMYNDAWCTTDGVSWTCANSKTPYAMSTSMGCVVFDEKLWLLGGRDGC